jgi:hypothetical protein
MKIRRKWIIVAAVAAALTAGLAGLLASGTFQTWAARRWLVAHPEIGATIGRVTAVPGRVQLAQLRIARPGYSIIVPALEVELPLLAALGGELRITRLVAKGLTVDLSQAGTAPVAAATPAPFASVLGRIVLPGDLSLDGVDLGGEFVIPATPGEPPVRTRLAISGGGLGAGRTGRLDFSINATLPGDAPVNAVAFTGRAAVTMATPREISAVEVTLDARARGPRLPQGATLAATLSAQRANAGEDYSISLESGGRRVAVMRAVQASGGPAAAPLRGAWSLNLADADVSPFSLGRPLPEFRFTGGGRLEADLAASSLALDGEAELSVNRLEVVDPRLAVLGNLRLEGTFDINRSPAGWAVRRLALDLAGAGPVLSLRSAQPFEFDPAGSLLKVADRDRDLMAVDLRAVPVAWARLFLPEGTVLAGGDLRGGVTVAARDNSFSLRTTTLAAAGVSLTGEGTRRFGPADLSLRLRGEYSVQGWSLEVDDLTARSGGANGVTLAGSIGRLAGAGQPLQLKGVLNSDLPALLGPLGLAGATGLSAGKATGVFSAILGPKREVEAHFNLKDLVALPGVTAENLPTVAVDLRANWERGGRIELRLPLAFERDGRRSDLNLAGFVTPGKNGFGIDGKVTSEVLVLDDAQVLLALVQSPRSSGGPVAAAGVAFWDGWTGRLGLDFRRIPYGAGQELQGVSGTLRAEPNSFRLDDGQAELSRSGDLKLKAELAFDGRAAAPYALKSDLEVTGLESAPWLLALNPGRPPVVDGRFSLKGQLTGAAREPAELLERAQGRWQLVSKGGLSRLLRTNIAEQIPESSTFSSLLGRAGSMLGSDRLENAANRAQNVLEVVRTLNEFKFDQLVIDISRGPDLNFKLTEFSLLSQELRLTGAGEIQYAAGQPWPRQDFSLRLQLLAQGQAGRLLARAGLLGQRVDPLGFSAFVTPITLEGPLGDPAASDLAATLLRAANNSLRENLLGR